LSDSTNAEREGTSVSEREVGESLGQLISGPLARGRVVVALFSSNLHRVQGVIRASLAQGRKLCLLGRSMVDNVRLALELGYLKCPPDAFIDPETADHFKPSELTILCTGAQGEPRSALARLALGEHPTIQLDKNDLVILSSRSIPGNERSVGNLIDHLVRRGCRVLGGTAGGGELVHATGHACQSEQRMMIDLVRPKSFVPIHGEYRMLVAHARTAEAAGVPRTLVVEDGAVVELRPNELAAQSTERAVSGRIYLDTRLSDGVGEVTLRDRQLLAYSGMLLCLVVLDRKTGEVVRPPELLGKGVSGLDESRLNAARANALAALNDLPPAQRTDAALVEEALRRAVRSAWRKNVEKRPLVLPVVVEM
jgi:ribonuclease J